VQTARGRIGLDDVAGEVHDRHRVSGSLEDAAVLLIGRELGMRVGLARFTRGASRRKRDIWEFGERANLRVIGKGRVVPAAAWPTLRSEADDVRAGEPDPDPAWQPHSGLLPELLARLPENYRRVLELRFLEGCSIRETAIALGLSPGNVKVLQYRAVQRAATSSPSAIRSSTVVRMSGRPVRNMLTTCLYASRPCCI